MHFVFCDYCANNDETCSMCNECIAENGKYFEPKSRRPKVILLMAMTADGLIAKNSNHFTDWTGEADKRYFKFITMRSGVVIMGSNTFNTLGRALPDRLNVVMTSKKLIDTDKIDNVMFSNASAVVTLHKLKTLNYTQVCLIGGAHINTAFIHNNLIDEIHVIITPKLFGSGLTMFAKPANLDIDIELKQCSTLPGSHVLLVYNVKKGD